MAGPRLPKYTILLDARTKAYQRRLRGTTDLTFSAFLREAIGYISEHPDVEAAILARCEPEEPPARATESPAPAADTNPVAPPPTTTVTAPVVDMLEQLQTTVPGTAAVDDEAVEPEEPGPFEEASAPERVPQPLVPGDWDGYDDTSGPSPDEEPEPVPDDGFWA